MHLLFECDVEKSAYDDCRIPIPFDIGTVVSVLLTYTVVVPPQKLKVYVVANGC